MKPPVIGGSRAQGQLLGRPLDAVVAHVPVDEAAHAVLGARRRTEADIPLQIVHVGIRSGHVTRLHVEQALLRLAANASSSTSIMCPTCIGVLFPMLSMRER